MRSSDPQRRGRGRVALAGLTTLYAASRLPGLRAMPIFGDEAIHVHWAQLVAANPLAHAFVSLQDPKPPLQFWLIALCLPLFDDPLLAGRVVSVAAGAASLWLAAGLTREMANRFRFGDGIRRYAGVFAALFLLFCPFAAFYQRMALAESLFAAESLAGAWLSLRVAGQDRRSEETPPAVWARGLALGTVFGVAMLTRQSLSYVLWALPIAAYLSLPREERAGTSLFIRRMLVAVAAALLAWSPFLLARGGPSLLVRIFHAAVYREPLSLDGRLANAASIGRWVWMYLTPPVAVFALLSMAWLVISRRRRCLFFLLTWFAVTTLPLALFGSILFSRYVLPAVLPLGAAGGLFLAAIASRLRSISARSVRVALGAAIGALLFVWPARELVRQATDWKSQKLAAVDRWQYASGWPAGTGTENAIGFLEKRARQTPLVLITPEIGGNPTDAAWVFLRGNPRVRLFAVRGSSPGTALRPAEPGSDAYLLSGDLREGSPEVPTRLPERWPVYFLAPDPFLTAGGWREAADFVAAANPGASVAARFENPAGAPGEPPSAVTVFRVR